MEKELTPINQAIESIKITKTVSKGEEFIKEVCLNIVKFSLHAEQELLSENEKLKSDNKELLECLKWAFRNVGKPVARNKHNANYFDKYFEIESLIQKISKDE